MLENLLIQANGLLPYLTDLAHNIFINFRPINSWLSVLACCIVSNHRPKVRLFGYALMMITNPYWSIDAYMRGDADQLKMWTIYVATVIYGLWNSYRAIPPEKRGRWGI